MIFEHLSEIEVSLRRILLERCADTILHRDVRRGRPVYSCGDDRREFYFLERGRIWIGQISAAGKIMILQVVRPGQLFGETAVASGGKHSEEARALEDSLYLSVPVARIRHVLGEDSTLSIQFLEILSHRLVESRQRAADLAFNTNPRRLAKFLLEEARLRGVRNNGSMHLRLGLTHEQLAQTIGTSREIVTSILNNLRRQAIIDYQGNSYSIFPEKLERFLSPLA